MHDGLITAQVSFELQRYFKFISLASLSKSEEIFSSGPAPNVFSSEVWKYCFRSYEKWIFARFQGTFFNQKALLNREQLLTSQRATPK